jgi:hypothetical protein
MDDAAHNPDLEAAAEEELKGALSLSWAELARVTPWGDVFEGFSPAGRPIQLERSYIWADGEGGDILVEVAAFSNPVLYDRAARRSVRLRRRG